MAIFSPAIGGTSDSPRLAGLEILQCIPVVKIFVFLDLAKNLSFSDSLLGFTTFSFNY